MAQPVMTAYTLRRLRPSAAFLGPYPRLTKKLLKLALELFGSGEKETAPRLQVKGFIGADFGSFAQTMGQESFCLALPDHPIRTRFRLLP